MHLIIFLIVLLSGTGYQLSGQTLAEKWDSASQTNKSLMPKYGYAEKSREEIKADNKFVQSILSQGSRREGAEQLVRIGFTLLAEKDPVTAMYRFNQAWLVDSTYAEIFDGFGNVFLYLEDYGRARLQIEEGLALDSLNPALLRDYAFFFMKGFYGLPADSVSDPVADLDTALMLLNKSYSGQPADAITTFRLSACYMLRRKCDKAWQFYRECKIQGGALITEKFTSELKRTCGQKK